ncbi:pyridoxal phosphate-dependent decarboxylase family protein [Gaopeijia maritima]|uniref:Pyridoxal-dependent decarboxylase n=1 Tax=Gaopeijia maritima TaxID=3119007 RepID=A0ABU9EBY5_9BACT
MSSPETDDPTGDIHPEEFRRFGHEVVDWIADYLAGVDRLPVMPDLEPGALRTALPDRAPESPESLEAVLADFREQVVPATTHWNHPSFHAYFANTASGPGILGEMLAAALNANAMVWRTSPSATELEEVVTDWVARMLGLPDDFRGVINDTASSSSLYALAAAREMRLPESWASGLAGAPPGRIYTSEEAHSSIRKAATTLGFGRDGVRAIATDDDFRMRPDALRDALEDDRAAGVRPVAVVATIGTTSTTAVDPVADIAPIAEEAGVWLHVDAAYAGPMAALPEFAAHFRGWERAHSIVVNPHKWLFTPMDCSLLYCRRPDQLRAAFSLTPEYLRTPELASGTNLMDYGVSLGRRFRALKLWFVLRRFGVDGMVSRLREHVRLTRVVQGWVEATPGWEVLAPCPFATLIFRHAPADLDEAALDRHNRALMERVNRSGVAFFSHTEVRGRIGLRFSIGNLRTTEAHLRRTWGALESAAAEG